MANQKHLAILKQGVDIWNQWRQEHPRVKPNLKMSRLGNAKLRGANLRNVDLEGADLNNADLRETNLSGAHIRYTNFSRANLSRADVADVADVNYFTHSQFDDADFSEGNLRYISTDGAFFFKTSFRGADLSNAALSGAFCKNADFRSANLEGASFYESSLAGANFSDANLRGTFFEEESDLSEVNFTGTDLTNAILRGANLSGAILGKTILENVDLSDAKELETIQCTTASSIDKHTIDRSGGSIPEPFLRAIGASDTLIKYANVLANTPTPTSRRYYSCFISYSSKDEEFAKRLYADLQSNNVPCWFALEDMDIGDKIQPRIEESIRLYDKLLLVLSEQSIASNWVTYEVERSLKKEPEGVPNVLYPIRLDDAVMLSKTEWADDIRRTRHIGDFTHWTNHDDYQKAFNRLLRALKAEAQKMGSRDGATNGG